MSIKNKKLANSAPYDRYTGRAGDLKEPAKWVPAERALIEKYPIFNDNGPYLIGIKDAIGLRN